MSEEKLQEEAKKILFDTFGSEVAKLTGRFENPEKYPKDFLDQCTFFLAQLVGEEVANQKFQSLYKKYVKT